MGYEGRTELAQDTPYLPAMPLLLLSRQQMQALDTMYRLEPVTGNIGY